MIAIFAKQVNPAKVRSRYPRTDVNKR